MTFFQNGLLKNLLQVTVPVCKPMDIMLDEYYQVRGWKDGKVTEEKLRELEIIDPENQLV